MATSSASLARSPRKNWIEAVHGELPPYVRQVARAIHEKRGIPLSQAISFAIGRIKRWAAGGDNVNADTRAKAAKAVAQWEKLKAKAGKLTEAEVVGCQETHDDNLGIPTELLLAWISEEPLVESAANPPKRVYVRTKGGRVVNVTVEHARRMHANGTAATDQRPGAARGEFDESKHKRGGKGTREGGQFVSKGSSGTEVRAVQRRVGARVDGAFGDQTKAAVERFQKSHGLVVDGIVGKQTVAAMRGRRDAKRVGTGALSKRDREYLAGHIRGTGRHKSTGFSTKIVEAVAAPMFLERVQALEPGETARLPDGGAVKHEATTDARKVWTAGRPSTYGDGMSWDEQRRTPAEAVADALTRSAGSTDPASLGGPTRYSTYTRVAVNGTPARFAGVNVACQPLVRYDGDNDPVAVSWTELVPLPRLVE